MIIILHKALKLFPSLCKQPHKDDFLVCKKKKKSEHKAMTSSLLEPYVSLCWWEHALIHRTWVHVKQAQLFKALSNTQRALGPSKEPFLKQAPGLLHWHRPAASVPERHYPDENHVCLSPEDRAAPAIALQHPNPRWSKGLLLFLGAVLTKVSFHQSRKNALNKWIIHKMPTCCVSL